MSVLIFQQMLSHCPPVKQVVRKRRWWGETRWNKINVEMYCLLSLLNTGDASSSGKYLARILSLVVFSFLLPIYM